MCAFAFATGVIAIVLSAQARAAVPTYGEVRATYRTSETSFVDRRGEAVQVLRTDPAVRKLAWTPLGEVSPALRAALVYSEDRRFYEHAGVDWQAVGAAAWGNLWNTKTRGASTITMQLAGLLDADLHVVGGGRSMAQKIAQGTTALALERGWKKAEILEAYLNLVAYRGEIVGIGALSATLFEKYPSGLNAREGAIAAALVRAPNAYAPRVAERACAILKAEFLPDECRGLTDYTALVLARKSAPRLDSDPQLAPHFARMVLNGRAPDYASATQTVATTLDVRLQRFARSTLQAHLAELANRNVEDGAVVVLDNSSGDVLAWVGSSGGLSDAAEVDHVLAPRQAGSTLKPFLYELAIEQRWLTAASIVDDSPLDLATAGGLYIPQNYDHRFKGPVSVRTALASSLNIPAVRTVVMVTPERFHQRLKALGFSSLKESGDYYGYALALGSAEVSLAQLTNAYRALANGGRVGAMRTALKEGTRALASMPPVMSSAASFIVADILADRNARAATFGTDSVLAGRTWSAVKTGTSKDMRDNWCVGFSRRYTVGVWVGNSSGAAMWDVSGTTGAAPVWQAILRYLDERERASPDVARAGVEPPKGVVIERVVFDRHLEAARDELFLAGTETSRIVLASPGRTATRAIVAPIDGAIVALDPDIPQSRQRLRFASALNEADSVLVWKLDGKTVGRGRETTWALWPGRHALQLTNARGMYIDSVRFEVRGASVKSSGTRPAVKNRDHL